MTSKEIAVYQDRVKVASLDRLPYTGTSVALYEQELAVGGDDSKTHIYTIQNDKLVEKHVISTRSPVSAVSYSPNGAHLAVGDNGRQVEVFERSSWAALVQGQWVFHTSKITALSWSHDGTYLASGSLDENIFIWSLANPSKRVQLKFSHKGK